MSDHKDPKQQEYSLDDILAEYGSGKYGKPKVVEFPEREKAPVPPPAPPSPPEPGPDPVVFPQKEEAMVMVAMLLSGEMV